MVFQKWIKRRVVLIQKTDKQVSSLQLCQEAVHLWLFSQDLGAILRAVNLQGSENHLADTSHLVLGLI